MAATPGRSAVLGSVARRLAASRPGHPLRVGIDGACGSGKTTFSRELTGFVTAAGRTVVMVDSDGFHHVRARRYRQGRESAQGYYDDAYDLGSLAERVLLPPGPGGCRGYARYLAACGLYVSQQDPSGRASILIGNTDPGRAGHPAALGALAMGSRGPYPRLHACPDHCPAGAAALAGFLRGRPRAARRR